MKSLQGAARSSFHSDLGQHFCPWSIQSGRAPLHLDDPSDQVQTIQRTLQSSASTGEELQSKIFQLFAAGSLRNRILLCKFSSLGNSRSFFIADPTWRLLSGFLHCLPSGRPRSDLLFPSLCNDRRLHPCVEHLRSSFWSRPRDSIIFSSMERGTLHSVLRTEQFHRPSAVMQ